MAMCLSQVDSFIGSTHTLTQITLVAVTGGHDSFATSNHRRNEYRMPNLHLDFSRYRSIRDVNEIIEIVKNNYHSPVTSDCLFPQTITESNVYEALDAIHSELNWNFVRRLLVYAFLEDFNLSEWPEPEKRNFIEDNAFVPAYVEGIQVLKKIISQKHYPDFDPNDYIGPRPMKGGRVNLKK